MEDIWTSGKKYRVIYADPPWNFKTWSEKGEEKSASNHYSVMTLEDINKLPINSISTDDSILFLWATDPLLPHQINVMQYWGFTYKTVGFNWIKMNKNQWTPFIGLGYYTRSNPEYCLIGTKGSPGRPKRHDISQVVFDRIREHSRKPDIIRQHITDMYEGPRLELFARTQYPGWDVWGNETNKFVDDTLDRF